ncbi:uncharacterized protein LOC121909006 isoform X3 [Thunnus maccoyii]|uniref:uncharacterized protein LOC121909006 isoform X3 n=1 Tax=Thunnus maccoyii TaxID=8240 RepID=UPI001C4CAE39|nr:uncharacterized protein LOC121909006 isoform X3 [Thunnus maccoyii]
MSRLKGLKIFIHQRLTAAVEEIFGHLEKTITNYEEEMDCRLRELPDTVLDPEMQRAEAPPKSDAHCQGNTVATGRTDQYAGIWSVCCSRLCSSWARMWKRKSS